MESVFSNLKAINCDGYKEQKNGFDYLSWTYAWEQLCQKYPDATYEVVKFNGLPYVYDPQSGIMCYTTVTINGLTREMWLPVMNGANQALKFEPQVYKSYNRKAEKWEEKTIAAATMMDVNKTIMRCLVKNLAMFGLGLNIYAGEDYPEEIQEEQSTQQSAPTPAPQSNKKPMVDNPTILKIASALANSKTEDEWNRLAKGADDKYQISAASWDKIQKEVKRLRA